MKLIKSKGLICIKLIMRNAKVGKIEMLVVLIKFVDGRWGRSRRCWTEKRWWETSPFVLVAGASVITDLILVRF